jgi:hypothetical protein
MSSKSGYARFILYPVIALALMAAWVPSGTFAAPAAQGGSRLFPETNQTVSGRFLEVWSQNGDYATNLYINGFPLTDKHPEINFDDGKVYQTQWFERARFEEHPENSKPYDVLLGRLGAYTAEGRSDDPFKKLASKPSSCAANCDYFKESQHTVSGDIRTYFYKYGGIAQFGFPLSETFTEQSKDDPSKADRACSLRPTRRSRAASWKSGARTATTPPTSTSTASLSPTSTPKSTSTTARSIRPSGSSAPASRSTPRTPSRMMCCSGGSALIPPRVAAMLPSRRSPPSRPVVPPTATTSRRASTPSVATSAPTSTSMAASPSSASL